MTSLIFSLDWLADLLSGHWLCPACSTHSHHLGRSRSWKQKSMPMLRVLVQTCKNQFEKHRCTVGFSKISTKYASYEQSLGWFDWAKIIRLTNPRWCHMYPLCTSYQLQFWCERHLCPYTLLIEISYCHPWGAWSKCEVIFRKFIALQENTVLKDINNKVFCHVC